jgi:hypothetical protein
VKPENVLKQVNINKGLLNPMMLDMTSEKLNSSTKVVTKVMLTLESIELPHYPEYS